MAIRVNFKGAELTYPSHNGLTPEQYQDFIVRMAFNNVLRALKVMT